MHKGKLYPHVERVDWRFPDPPWRVPHKLWIWEGLSISGAYAGDFPPQPWEVGTSSFAVAGGLMIWTTNFPMVRGRTPQAVIRLALSMPACWLHAPFNVNSGMANYRGLFGTCITTNTFAPITWSGPFVMTEPANISGSDPGFARPKPW